MSVMASGGSFSSVAGGSWQHFNRIMLVADMSSSSGDGLNLVINWARAMGINSGATMTTTKRINTLPTIAEVQSSSVSKLESKRERAAEQLPQKQHPQLESETDKNSAIIAIAPLETHSDTSGTGISLPKRNARRKNTLPGKNMRRKAVALEDHEHLKIVEKITTFFDKTYDKHERFEALRYLSRRRRKLPINKTHTEAWLLRVTLNVLFKEGKRGQHDELSSNEGAFLPPRRKLSAVDIAKKDQRNMRITFV